MLRELIIKLATLYPTKEDANLILLYAGVPTRKIEFSAAGEKNWGNIFSFLLNHPPLHLKVLKILLKEMEDINDDINCIFFQDRINELEVSIINPGNQLNSEIFNIHSIFGDEYAFIDRQNVKTPFQKMILRKIPKNVLIVEGQPGVGMTYVHYYITEIITQFSSDFELVNISPENYFDEGDEVTGADLAQIISDRLSLGYSTEGKDKKTISKYATFLTKVNQSQERPAPNNKIPVICLDGIYKIINPSVNRFIGILLHEAIVSKKFYVILSIDDEFVRDDWHPLLKNISTIKINSFTKDDVETYVKAMFKKFNEDVDLGSSPKQLSQKWMEQNASNWSFEEDELNVKEIGEACTSWYKDLSNKIQEQLHG